MAMVTNNNNNNNNNNHHHHPIYKAPKALTSEALDELDYSQYDIDCADKKTYFTTQLFLILTAVYIIYSYTAYVLHNLYWQDATEVNITRST